MMDRIRALFTIAQMAISVTFIIIAMYIFKKSQKQIRQFWANRQIKLLGIDLQIIGELDETTDMLVMNHQSVLDITVFEHLHPRNLAWVAKKEIADIPWFGHILKAPAMIIVERESKSSLIKLLKDTKDRLSKGRPIAIFPEGTRSNGKKLRKFKAGTKIIANKHKLKVQPVILVGTRDILDSQNFKQKSGTVKVIYLPTVQADKSTNWYEQLEIDMRSILEKELNCDI